MNRILLFLWGLFLSGYTWSQNGLYVNGSSAVFTVKQNAFLHIDGDFQLLQAKPLPTDKTVNGQIYLTGNLVTNDTLFCEKQDNAPGTTPAQIHFIGNTDSHILGTIPPQLFQVVIAKTSGDVYVDHQVILLDTIRFLSGNVLIDTNVSVELVYRNGTVNVASKPYIIGESALHRFKGEGVLHSSFPIAVGHDISVANTGFYFRNHQSDTLDLVRGHKKMLYAGNGSIDRYFDVRFSGSTAAFHDTIAFKYLSDVDYSAMGVDTARLGVFISPQFQDMDFRRIQAMRIADSASVTNATQFSLPTVNVTPAFYRITMADTACSNPPVSTLPDTLLHICANDSVPVAAIQASNPFPVRCFWQDGSQEPNRFISSLASPQQLALQLIDSRGCVTRDTVYVDATAPNPTAQFTWDDACFGDSVFVYNSSVISSGSTTSSWAFGNSTFSVTADSTQGILYANSGSYTIRLEVTSNYGCKDTITHEVDVFNLPMAAFTLTEDCFNNQYITDASGSSGTTIPSPSNITVYNWKLDNNLLPQHTSGFFLSPPISGPHTLELAVETGNHCKDTLQQAFTVYAKDSTGFTNPAEACIGEAVTFMNNSTVQNANPTYLWSFGDGTTSTDANPIKSYSTPGTYPVQLTLSTDANCTSTVFGSITVHGVPNSSFTATNVCPLQQLAPLATTMELNLNYLWDFGDGFTSTQLLPQHAYTASGNYTLSLTLTNAHGCSTQTSQSVTVFPSPTASFSNSTVCAGSATTFTSNATGTGLSYSWNFGDLSIPSSVQNPSHVYAGSGTYNATFTVYDQHGCTASSTQNIIVNAAPVLAFGNISTCGLSYQLDALNTGSSYLWSPGNYTSQTIVATHSGTYNVTVTSPNGCNTTATTILTLNSNVIPDLGNDTTVCGGIMLNAHYPGSVYTWNDNSTAQTFFASAEGTYWVTVTDQNGCTGSDTVVVQHVYPTANPNLGADQVFCSENVPFVLNPGNFSTYNWNTGADGSTFSVSQTGIYAVEVTDIHNCSGSDTISITVHHTPVVELDDNLTACDQVTLVASTNSGNAFLWNDGNTDQIRTVTASGIYTVTVTNPDGGCSASDTSQVTIHVTPAIDLGADTTVCSNNPLTLDASGFAGASYNWTSTSGATVGTNATFTPPSSDTYIVHVNQQGCTGSDAIVVTLLPAPFIDAHPPVYYICGTTPVTLNGSPFGTNSWSSPNGFSSTDSEIQVYQSGDYYLVSHVAGCTATEQFTLTESPNQIQAFYMVDNDTTKNNALKFIDLSEPDPLTYLWDFGDGTYDTVPYPVHEYSVVDTFYTSLTVSNGICISRYEKAVNQKNFLIPDNSYAAALDFVHIQLYPNPADDQAKLVIALNDNATTIRVQLCDALGNVLQTDESTNTDQLSIDYQLTHLASGIYFIRIQAESLKGKLTQTRKLLTSNY